jgi:magnesium-transporting ATPase (P-type)
MYVQCILLLDIIIQKSSHRAVGAAYLARRKAIVQKLTAIESLAGKTV